jgi:hypothetical protein
MLRWDAQLVPVLLNWFALTLHRLTVALDAGSSSLLNLCFDPCLVHPVALAISKKNETPLLATVFVVLSTLHYYMFRPT